MESGRLTWTIAGIPETRSVQFTSRLVLGGVFVYASIAKIASPREFATTVIKYGILPEKSAIHLIGRDAALLVCGIYLFSHRVKILRARQPCP